MGKRIKYIIYLLTVLLFVSCEEVVDYQCNLSCNLFFKKRKIEKILKQSATSADKIYTIDLQFLFTEEIDRIFYCNGPLSASDIMSLTDWQDCMKCPVSTLQDNQSRIIIFSRNQVLYFETFNIKHCYIQVSNGHFLTNNTILSVRKYNKNEYEITPYI